MTPVVNIHSPRGEAYNTAHCGTHCTTEICISILNHCWHCLQTELIATPQKACKISCACAVLHNCATELNHVFDDPAMEDDNDDDSSTAAVPIRTITEQAQLAAGKAARDSLIYNNGIL